MLQTTVVPMQMRVYILSYRYTGRNGKLQLMEPFTALFITSDNSLTPSKTFYQTYRHRVHVYITYARFCFHSKQIVHFRPRPDEWLPFYGWNIDSRYLLRPAFIRAREKSDFLSSLKYLPRLTLYCKDKKYRHGLFIFH